MARQAVNTHRNMWPPAIVDTRTTTNSPERRRVDWHPPPSHRPREPEQPNSENTRWTGALPAGEAAPPSATTGTRARRARTDTRESAVMTSTETDSGHTIQRWGHRRWPHVDRPDPDATVTAEAIEQRPGVPSADAPTHPNREPAPPGTTRSTNLRAGSPDRRTHRTAAPLVTTRKTGGRPPGCTYSVLERCAQRNQRNQRKRQRPETPTERDCPAIYLRHRQPPRPDQPLAPVAE